MSRTTTIAGKLYALMISKVMCSFHGDHDLAHDAAVETWLSALRKGESAFESEGALVGYCLFKVVRMAIDLKRKSRSITGCGKLLDDVADDEEETSPASGKMLGTSLPRPWPGCRDSSGRSSNSRTENRSRTVTSPSTSWNIRTLATPNASQSSDVGRQH